MCGKLKSVNHVLAQKEYKRRHNWFGTKIHLEICRKYATEVKEKWSERKSEVVMENDQCKILRWFTVQTDHEIYGTRPDVIVIQKDNRFLPDNRFYLSLWWKSRYWRTGKNKTLPEFGTTVEKDMKEKVKVIPLVIGAPGTTHIKFRKLQKSVLLHNAGILQKVLDGVTIKNTGSWKPRNTGEFKFKTRSQNTCSTVALSEVTNQAEVKKYVTATNSSPKHPSEPQIWEKPNLGPLNPLSPKT